MEDVRVVFLSDGRPFEKNGVIKLFDSILLNSSHMRLLMNFEVHAIGFGIETDHWSNLRFLAEATKGTFQVAGFKFLELTKSFTSVAATITNDQSLSSGPLLKAAALDIPFDPDFDTWRFSEGSCGLQRRVITRKCTSMRHQFTDSRNNETTRVYKEDVEVVVDLKPFNFGGMRLVFGMTDSSWRNGQAPLVAKRLIKEPHASLDDMLPFCRCTNFAIRLRGGFVSRAKAWKVELDYNIWFLPCYLYKYQQCTGVDGYFVGEQRLDATSSPFVKFNGNNGYVNPQNLKGNELMQAFSHHTFIRSKGKCLVVDLQGVLDNDTLLLTDPQVHSRFQKFGRGDLGIEGMKLFFASHRCGKTCQALGLLGLQDDLLKNMTTEKNRRCVLCFDAPSKTVLQPCGHSALCRTCASDLLEKEGPRCPICRTPVERFEVGVFSSTFVAKKRVSFQ
eukprot:TRINITY_DN21655_c0_g1_i1.p1 TRINITY_DN21655_c0_g1~~TRINITY_DN21655_c0_g1_i1.p1  ORF type:complete len:476 (-),score=57.59 TRINITY_DN21655_c0_g1_i1:267-1607(-)